MLTLRSSLLSAVAALSVFASTIQPAAALVSTYTTNGDVYRVVQYVGSDSENIRVSTVLKGPAARDTFAARTIPIKQSRFSSWFKPRLGSLVKANLWWMGFAAVIESAGWAIDELNGEVVQPLVNYEYGFFYMVADYPDADVTPEKSCAKYVSSQGSQYTSSFSGSLCTMLNSDGNVIETVRVNKAACQTYASNPLIMALPSCVSVSVAPTVPVSDADLLAAINAQLAADPAHAATAFTDPATGRGYDDLFDPVPYIPGLSAADEALVNCYISGQLQMVNSQTACYVATQAEYDRVKQQAEALAAGRTPEGEADALNETMKQPLTQTQYEETNKKYSDAVADVTASLGSQAESDVSEIEDNFNDLDGIITDLPNTSLPAPAHMTVPQYVDCKQIHLSDGNGHDLDFPSASQCAKIETFKQGFGYFLAISVVFLLSMQLLTRPHG